MTTVSMVRKGLVARPKNPSQPASLAEAVSVCCELLSMGFSLSPEELVQLDTDSLTQLLTSASEVSGVSRTWIPMYPGFPQQVIQCSNLELFRDQLVHYLSHGEVLPEVVQEFSRSPQGMAAELIPLRLFSPTASDLAQLWGQAVGLGKTDVDFAHDLARWLGAEVCTVFEDVRFVSGENFALACHTLKEMGVAGVFELGVEKARHVDDLLRLVLVCYGRGARYLRAVAVHSIPRTGRRMLLDALARFDQPHNRTLLVRRKRLWQKVMRKVHPYSLPNAPKELLGIIHENDGYQAPNAQVEKALLAKDVAKACELLVDEPGHLVRRVDHLMCLVSEKFLLNRAHHKRALDHALSQALPHVRLTTLLSLLNHLRTRYNKVRIVKIFGRGQTLIRKERKPINSHVFQLVYRHVMDAIMVRLSHTTAPSSPVNVGSNIPLRLVGRDASETSVPLKPGQRVALKDPEGHVNEKAQIVRMFVHWYGRDVDLGVILTDATVRSKIGIVDYTNHHCQPFHKAVTHSGDIIDASEGACEFIDIDVAELKRKHPTVRYVICSVVSYSSGMFHYLDCLTGAMIREHGMAGEVFEPRSVVTAARPTVYSTSAIPYVIDLKTMELMWLDTSLGTKRGSYSTGRSRALELVEAEMKRLHRVVTEGELLSWWASVHHAQTANGFVHDAQIDAILASC